MRTLLGVLLLAMPALAQQGGAVQSNLETGKAGDRPWAVGVTEAEQKRALDLFKEGNQALKEPNFQRAAQKYKEALSHWDHPGIHYNYALALLNLVQPVETHEQFVAALKFGPAALDADKFEQANRYKSQLEAQLASVDIRCNMEGAQVKLDGKLLYNAPGRYTAFTIPGPHSIVATKVGYITNELSLPLPAGQTKVFELNLMSDDDLTEYKRMWPQYVPYVVLAAGVAVAAVGLGLHLGSKGLYTTYDTGVSDCAQSTMFHGGCATNPTLDSARIKADVVQGAGFAAYAVGGVVAAVGAILIYANRLQAYRITVGVTSGSRTFTFLPFFGPSGGGAALTGAF